MNRLAVLTVSMTSILTSAFTFVPGNELAGNSLEARRSDGARAAMYFNADGTARFVGAYEDDVWEAPGTYTVKDGQLCMELANEPRDCWRYPAALALGVETSLRNVDGRFEGRFRLVEGHAAKLPAAAD